MISPLRNILAMALAATLGLALPASGQNPPQIDLNRTVHEMGERVRHLGEDVASDMGNTPTGRHLAQDTQELAQAIDEFHETLHDVRDPRQLRQAYTGIEQTWQHLRGQLARGASPAVIRAADRVEALDDQIRQALGLNPPPVGFYQSPQAPAGIADTARLAHALSSRADTLAVTIQTQMRGLPGGNALTRDAVELARLTDQFHDTIDQGQPIQVAAQAFGPVDVLADRIEQGIVNGRVPVGVQQAWRSFAAVENLIHRNLGLDAPPPQVYVETSHPDVGPPLIVGLTRKLVVQIEDYLRAFAPTADVVPEGHAMLAEAQRLQAGAIAFQAQLDQGAPPNQLAYGFRDVDASWRRLSRRISRIAKGRTGPNIRQVQLIGETCDQIERELGMPGYAPNFANPAFGGHRDHDHR